MILPTVEVQMTRTRIPYLGEVTLSIVVGNPFEHSIQLTSLACQLELEPGLTAIQPSMSLVETVKPRGRSTRIFLNCTADPAYKQFTNTIKVHLTWLGPGAQEAVIEPAPPSYLQFESLLPLNRGVFISHKDPQDEREATLLQHFLAKVGYRGYLAKFDRKPGVDIWKDKIPAAMRDSVCLAVLWTKNASTDPRGVLREIELAKSMGKTIILAKEKDVAVPAGFPTDIEYFEMPTPFSPNSLRDLAVTIFNVAEGRGI